MAGGAIRGLSVSRPVGLIMGGAVWVVGIPLAHGVLPWAVSLLTLRHGWVEDRPGTWNLPGLIPIIVATACLLWVMVVHFSRISGRVELRLTPKYVLMRGPYAFTRNPMYVAELMLWFGWSVFFGSAAVFIGFLVAWAAMNFLVVPREERTLESHFGDGYLRYKDSVPRWMGRAGR